MKKFLFFAALLAISLVAKAECGDGPYGLQINGTKVVEAPKFGDNDSQGRVQYKASCVELAVGDKIKLINTSCDATWMIDIDPYGAFQSFDGGKEAGHFIFDGFLAKVNYENPPTDTTIVGKCPRKCIAEDAHFEAGT